MPYQRLPRAWLALFSFMEADLIIDVDAAVYHVGEGREDRLLHKLIEHDCVDLRAVILHEEGLNFRLKRRAKSNHVDHIYTTKIKMQDLGFENYR
jgi:hypothetical protein